MRYCGTLAHVGLRLHEAGRQLWCTQVQGGPSCRCVMCHNVQCHAATCSLLLLGPSLLLVSPAQLLDKIGITAKGMQKCHTEGHVDSIDQSAGTSAVILLMCYVMCSVQPSFAPCMQLYQPPLAASIPVHNRKLLP